MLAFYQIRAERLILPGEMTLYLTREQIQIRMNVCADNDHCESGAWYRVSAYRHNNLHFAPGEIIGLAEPPPSYLASAFISLATSPNQVYSIPLSTGESSTPQPALSPSSPRFNLVPLPQLRVLSASDFFHLTGLTHSAFDEWMQQLQALASSPSQRGRPSRFTREQRLAITLIYHQHPTLRAAQLAAAYGCTESRICQIIRALTQSLNALQLMPISQRCRA